MSSGSGSSSSQRLVLYVLDGKHCDQCTAAKQLLERKGYVYQTVGVRAKTQLPRGSDGTVPQLVYGSTLIGGFSHMSSWLKNVPDAPRRPKPPQAEQVDDDSPFLRMFSGQNLMGAGTPDSPPVDYIDDATQLQSHGNDVCGLDSCFVPSR